MKQGIWRYIDPAFSLDDAGVSPVVNELAGWLVREEDAYLVIASERSSDGGFRQFTAIPRTLVENRGR